MPDLRCEHCGSVVTIRGIAGVCPVCKELVTPPPPSMQGSEPPAAPVSGFTEPPFAQRAPVEPIRGPRAAGRPAAWKVVGVAIAATIGVVILIDYVRLRFRAPTVVQVAVPQSAAPQSGARVEPQQAVERPSPKPAGKPVEPVATADTPASPDPPEPPAATRPTKPAHPFSSLAGFRPRAPSTATADRISDEQIGKTIQRGVDFLLSQFAATRLKNADNYDAETFAGLNALCVYALLHAGQAISDPRLSIQNEQIKGIIARMKESPMEGSRATYSRAIRIAALAVYDRPEDRAMIEKDAHWLLASSIQGAFTYSKPSSGGTRSGGGWDNSNSQYGALGLWSAAEVGIRVPPSFWQDVESHWTEAQTHSGGWGYSPGAQSATLAMTAAGVTSLFVAREQLGTQPNVPESGPLPRAILRGLEWLDEGDNSVGIFAHPGYTLYGLERAGLASGYKFFGKHDWYLELAAKAIAEQREDGSWAGGDGTLAETAFTLLFLSRGRHPIFVSKLRFAGNWANRPRDIANLTRFAGRELERPLNWQTVGLERDWTEWTDAPVLFIASDQPPNLTDSDIDKIRAYVGAGGMIFTHADKNSESFNRYITRQLAPRLFPDRELRPIAEGHPIDTVVFPLATRPDLLAVDNGARLLWVHSPTDLARAWTVRPIRSNRPQFEAAINVIVYAAGRREFRNRLNSIYVAPPSEKPIATVSVARLQYDGNWDPEPGAWPRFGRVLQRRTGLSTAPILIKIEDLKFDTAPLAHLTGTNAVTFTEPEVDALRQFVTSGGVLLVDACGGSREFFKSIQSGLLPRLFPASEPRPIEDTHPLLSGRGEGMENLTKPLLRPYTVESRGRERGSISIFTAGRGAVVISGLDLTSGLLGTGTWGIAGFQPAYAESFIKNLVLWTISRIPRG